METAETTPIMIESLHPYPDNLNDTKPLTLETRDSSDVKGMKIWFDEESSSEQNYDYVQFFRRNDFSPESQVGEQKYTGRKGSNNYPTKGIDDQSFGDCYIFSSSFPNFGGF